MPLMPNSHATVMITTKTTQISLTFSFLLLFTSINAQANQKIEGCFVAKEECEALHSIKKHSNPGHIKLEPFGLYSVIARNKKKASHYLLDIPSSDATQPSVQRWIPLSCGNYIANCRITTINLNSPAQLDHPETNSSQLNQAIPKSGRSSTPLKKPQYLLALSWEPSFCETHQQKTECKTLTNDRFDAHHLSLHGLWPQPRNNAYCNVDSTTKAIDRRKKWHLIKTLELSEKTRNALAISMPGYASNLQRHEWTKHGTCYGTSADIYYQHSIQLAKLVNQSSVGLLLDNNIGKKVTAEAIRKAFDQSFGAGSGSKVNVRCDKKGRLAELWINLSGKISMQSDLGELLKDSPNTKNGCASALIDPA